MNQRPANVSSGPLRLAAMEGHGAYNRNSQRQAAAGALALPVLEKAARVVDPGPGDRPVLVADYGSSQGRNSMRPMHAAVSVLRERVGAERPICVTHTDLPGNDFTTLFRLLQADPDSYLRDQPNIFFSAVGRSFYESVLPPASVSLGWSSYAANWLSRVPAYIPGNFFELRATGAALEAFDAQAAIDWQAFLSLRARELRPTGRLVLALPALNENGIHGMEPIVDAANETLALLVDRGMISTAERARMVVPNRTRGRAQLLAPFTETGSFAGLTVEHCEVVHLPEGAWTKYREHRDAQRLASDRAGFFRAVFVSSLAAALDPAKSLSDKLAFAEALEAELARRMAVELRELPSAGAILVVARQPD